MALRRSLMSLGIAAGMALTTSMAFAQYPPAGGAAPGGYPPAGGASAGGYPAGGTTGTVQQTTLSTDTTATTPGKLPKAGGEPLIVMAAGSLLLTAGYSVRRKFRSS